MKMDDQGKSYIEVSCGELNGVLYLEMLCKTAGAKGMNKCILCDSNMLTPSEFKLNGGKKANKAWKKSIKHKNKSLAGPYAAFLKGELHRRRVSDYDCSYAVGISPQPI